MAEEEKAQETTERKEETTTVETREPASETRREERREEKREETPAATETPEKRVDCPECALDVRESSLALHRFRAHGIDRRQDGGKQKPTGKRKPAAGKDEKKEEENGDGDKENAGKAKPSRWAEVRRSW